MNQFIEVTSPTAADLRWTVNVAQIAMVRRKDGADHCVIVLSTGGSIEPAEKYAVVQDAIKAFGVA